MPTQTHLSPSVQLSSPSSFAAAASHPSSPREAPRKCDADRLLTASWPKSNTSYMRNEGLISAPCSPPSSPSPPPSLPVSLSVLSSEPSRERTSPPEQEVSLWLGTNQLSIKGTGDGLPPFNFEAADRPSPCRPLLGFYYRDCAGLVAFLPVESVSSPPLCSACLATCPSPLPGHAGDKPTAHSLVLVRYLVSELRSSTSPPIAAAVAATPTAVPFGKPSHALVQRPRSMDDAGVLDDRARSHASLWRLNWLHVCAWMLALAVVLGCAFFLIFFALVAMEEQVHLPSLSFSGRLPHCSRGLDGRS